MESRDRVSGIGDIGFIVLAIVLVPAILFLRPAFDMSVGYWLYVEYDIDVWSYRFVCFAPAAIVFVYGIVRIARRLRPRN